MRKILYLLVVSFVFFSCQKEDEPTPTKLIGSSWTYRPDKNHYETIEFLNTSDVHVSGNLNGAGYSKDGIYTYNKNYLTIELKNEMKAGYISGNSLWLQDPVLQILFPESGFSFQYKKTK